MVKVRALVNLSFPSGFKLPGEVFEISEDQVQELSQRNFIEQVAETIIPEIKIVEPPAEIVNLEPEVLDVELPEIKEPELQPTENEAPIETELKAPEIKIPGLVVKGGKGKK